MKNSNDFEIVRGNDIHMIDGSREPLWLARRAGSTDPWAHGKTQEEARDALLRREACPPAWFIRQQGGVA